jgi:hypothetical protein
MRFRFIEDRRADYPVTVLCDVLMASGPTHSESQRGSSRTHHGYDVLMTCLIGISALTQRE